VIPWRRTQEKVRTGRSFRAEEILKEEESTARSRRGASRSPVRPSDLGEVARDLALRRRKETRAIGIRLIGVCGGRSFILVEIAISDFPTQLEPLIATGTRGTGSREVGVRHSGFSSVKGLRPLKS
jgi:hypothetical protein